MDIFCNPNYSTMWAAIGTIAQSFASIMAIIALLYSMSTYRKSLQVSHYTELDTMYFNLLKAVVDKPHLNNPKAIRTEEQEIEYDSYAFMVWNFLEAIYDRCECHAHLCSTWYPVIDTEHQKHRMWFAHPDNKNKFKDAFHEFIRNNGFTKR